MFALSFVLLSAAPCLELNEAAPGWKEVKLTKEAPSLAAPDSFAQFRSGERVSVVQNESGLYKVGSPNGGSTDFELELPRGARSVTVTFKESLRGARVDVTSWGMSIVHDQRVRGDTLTFSWGETEVARVWIRVHQHLREQPVLMEQRVERWVLPAELGLPPSFATPGALFFYQPEAGQRVVLCDAPGRSLSVNPAALGRATGGVAKVATSR